MRPYRLVVAGRARLAIDRASAWWKTNRTSAPDLFAFELTSAFELIVTAPAGGEPWPSHTPGVRRWLLPRTRYHIYYVADATETLVTVRMLWYAGRQRGPKL